MAVTTPLALRWQRAQQIDRSAIIDMGNGWFRVPSQHGSAGYAVQVSFDHRGHLSAASCTCPDFCKPTQGQGAPVLRDVRVCKHVLAACLRVDELGLRLRTPKPEEVCQKASEAVPLTATETFPTAQEPIWDDICLEWVLIDSDGICYWGETPSQCYDRFHEALHYLAESARKSGLSVSELREFRAQQRDYEAAQQDERPY
jgi:hypothetical protein